MKKQTLKDIEKEISQQLKACKAHTKITSGPLSNMAIQHMRGQISGLKSALEVIEESKQ